MDRIDPVGLEPFGIPNNPDLYYFGKGIAQLWEFFVGGRVSVEQNEVEMAQGGPGGVVGGAASAATFRLCPIEENPSPISQAGMVAGARMVLVLDPMERIVTGKDVRGESTVLILDVIDLVCDCAVVYFTYLPSKSSGNNFLTQMEFDFIRHMDDYNPNYVMYKATQFDPSLLRQGEYTLNLRI